MRETCFVAIVGKARQRNGGLSERFGRIKPLQFRHTEPYRLDCSLCIAACLRPVEPLIQLDERCADNIKASPGAPRHVFQGADVLNAGAGRVLQVIESVHAIKNLFSEQPKRAYRCGGGQRGNLDAVEAARKRCVCRRCVAGLDFGRVELIQVGLQRVDVNSAHPGKRLLILAARLVARFHRGGSALDAADHVAGGRFNLLSGGLAAVAYGREPFTRFGAGIARGSAQLADLALGLIGAGDNTVHVHANFDLGF